MFNIFPANCGTIPIAHHHQAGCGELAAVHGEVPRLGALAAVKMMFLVETCGNGRSVIQFPVPF